MKRIGFFAVIGMLIFISCKKEKFEPVTQKEKNDTTVTNPPYWCVKSAELRKFNNNISFKFEYDDKSLLKIARVGGVIHTYTYEGNKLIYRKSVRNDSLIQEEFRTYDGERIKTIEIKANEIYVYTTYEYEAEIVKTETIHNYGFEPTSLFNPKPDTILTTFHNYPDSLTAETNYISSQLGQKPIYVFKEKLIKSNKITILKYEYSDSVIVKLEEHKNLLNPIIWNLFDLDFYFASYTSYYMKSVLLTRDHNPYFYDALAHGYGLENQNKANYYYNNTGRINRITYGTKHSYNGEEPAFPIELNLTY